MTIDSKAKEIGLETLKHFPFPLRNGHLWDTYLRLFERDPFYKPIKDLGLVLLKIEMLDQIISFLVTESFK